VRNLQSVRETRQNGLRIRPYAWDDLRFPATGINPPGAVSDPTQDTDDGLLVFSATATNTIAGLAQMPHAWAMGTAIYPHIHWMPSSTNVGNVLWRFEYKVVNYGAVMPGAYTSVDAVDAAGGTANKHSITAFGAVDMAGGTLSTCIAWKLSRIGGDVLDTFTGTAKLLEVDFHYQSDSLGSEEEREKFDG
jgi:hypothetical protein